MRSLREHKGQDDSLAELRLLSEVARTPETTQRSLARRLDVSLGLINLLLKNVARKGYVKVANANWRRRLYALTPLGMVRRVRLTGSYVSRFLGEYQDVKRILRSSLASVALHAESRVGIYGTGEFAELIYLGLRELGIEEIEVYEPAADGRRFLGMAVRDATELVPGQADRVIVADLDDGEAVRQRLMSADFAAHQVVSLFDTLGSESYGPDDGSDGAEETA